MQPDSPPGKVVAIALDLDGTLVDSAPDLAAAANKALSALGHATLPAAQIRTMIGDGIDMLLQRCLQTVLQRAPHPDELAEGSRLMRDFYRDQVFRLGAIYPGVMPALKRWRGRGLILACVTNKASEFTRPLLCAAGLEHYLQGPYCADSPDQRKPSPALLIQFMRDAAVAPQHCVMVGDSTHDMMAAQAAGMRAAAVTYGYGNPLGQGSAPWRVADRLDQLELE